MSPASPIQIPGYELIRELGVGGMATVHLALQTSLDRKVALKIMRRNIDDAEKFEKRFLVEGRTLAKLPHRNIVAVYDIVKSESATYISMEYLEGGTLHEHMASGLSLGEAVAIVVQIAGALQFAHDHNVVHRDLKPANIMFRDLATPVLTDFGIARQQDAQSTRLTQTGMLVGTPTYMSPEQINALEVDGRSDLYSLGVMFFELLTGKPPFQGDSPIAVLMSHLTTTPPPLPSPYEEFQPILDRMLAKNRDERFADLKEFTKALKAVVVNNETLWSRLQADPNQSSSEQLRALGFSVSQTVGDALQNPLQARKSAQLSSPGFRELPTQGGKLPQASADAVQARPSASAIAAEATAHRAQLPPSEPGLSGARGSARKRPGWLIPSAVGFALMLVGLLIWGLMRNTGEIDPSIKNDVDVRLLAVDKYLNEGKLLPVDGRDNAFDYFLEQRQRAPKYSGVKLRGDALLSALKVRINEQIKRGNYDEALTTQSVVADVWGDDAELKAMAATIEASKLRTEQLARLDDLLKGAQSAAASGKDLGPAGSYALVSEAARVAPEDARVAKLLAEVRLRLLGPVRVALGAQRLEDASTRLEALAPQLRTDAEWMLLQKQLAEAVDRRARNQQMQVLYARLDGEINQGRLTDPPTDNALQTLEEIRNLDSNHPDLPGRVERLTNALAAVSRRSLGAGDASAALQQIDVALRLSPANTAALALKTEAEGKLSSDQRVLVQLIGDARQALVDRRFVEPAKNNAREYLAEALRRDPGNKEAMGLQQALPQRIAEAATALAEQGQVKAAIELLRSTRPLYPTSKELAALVPLFDAQLAKSERDQQRRARIESIQAAADQRPLQDEKFAAAVTVTAELLEGNAQDVDVLTMRLRLADALAESAATTTSPSELDRLLALAEQFRTRLGDKSGIEKVIEGLQQRRDQLKQDEARRLAESAGTLMLLAQPWGKVESITDSARNSVTLPADSTTPLQLTLPAGVYRVRFSHPDGGTSDRTVQVKAGTSVNASATFSRLNSQEYRRRVGL